MKTCRSCKRDLALDRFALDRSAKNGRAGMCRSCYREYYRINKDRCDATTSRIYYAKRKEILDFLRANSCVDCGETDPVVLEFDHLRDKLYEPSKLALRSRKIIQAELEKCEVVCANCHRRRTAKVQNWFKGR